MAVLAVLDNQSSPLSLPEILALLPDGFPERTVRRWLAEFVDEGRVAKTGRRRGTRYETRRADADEGIFSRAALTALAQVRQPLFARPPVTYNFDWFNSYDPNSTSYFRPARLAALAEQGRHRFDQEPAGTYARRIYNRLLIDLSYNSSRLEGNTYSLIDTERLILEGTRADGKLDEEMVMILNHKEAIRHLVDNAARLEVAYDEICTLHYLLSDGLVAVPYAGKIRDHGVRVGGSTYVPMENDGVLARQLSTIAEKAAAIDNPYEQSLFLLVHVAYLQAFSDVNKRTSRLCANIPLIRHNRVPLSFNLVEKDDYASAMIAVYELNDCQPLADLYYASYVRTCHEYEATAEAIGFDEIRVRYRQQRRDAVATIVNEELKGTAADEFLALAVETIPKEHRMSFLEDVKEDLDALSPHRIAGLAVSQRQLQRYLALQDR
ncbi:MAG: Fic family protein [Gammaproteobacteria bacterium]|nr:Fic family protein [Gammaproteobacteria bacterium]